MPSQGSNCIKLSDCLLANLSCIGGKCGEPQETHSCFPGKVGCANGLICDFNSRRCKPISHPFGKFHNILDCGPDQYHDFHCLPRMKEGDICSESKNQCAEGFGCSSSESTCQQLCIMGDSNFGCPAGRSCVLMSSTKAGTAATSNLGVCEVPKGFARSDNPIFMASLIFGSLFVFLLIVILIRRRRGASVIVASAPAQPQVVNMAPPPGPAPVFYAAPPPPPQPVATTTYYYSSQQPQTTAHYYYR